MTAQTTVEGWVELFSKASQQKQELTELLTIVKEINPKKVVEIGMDQGFSVEVWEKVLQPNSIIGIEARPEGINYKPKEKFHLIEGLSTDEFVMQQFIVAVDGAVDVDFLFIDGDHTYETVKSDFERYGKFVKSGGIIAFHDIMLDEPRWVEAGVEVCRLWKELESKYPGQTKAIHYPGGTGTGVFFVR